jgi:hypothetical protein
MKYEVFPTSPPDPSLDVAFPAPTLKVARRIVKSNSDPARLPSVFAEDERIIDLGYCLAYGNGRLAIRPVHR